MDAAPASSSSSSSSCGGAAPAAPAAPAAAAPLPSSPRGFEYLDHTADVQLHAWGDTLAEAFAQAVLALHGYIVDPAACSFPGGIDCVEGCTAVLTAQGHDLESLLFNFLDEFLFHFCTEFVVFGRVEVLELERDAAGGDNSHRIVARAHGEPYDANKHGSGTEVKAITYSNLQVWDRVPADAAGRGLAEVFVIVDI